MASEEKIASLFAEVGAKINKGSFAAVDNALGKLKGAVAGFLAVDAVKDFLTGAINDTIEFGGKIADAEQKTGVAGETLQEYGHIAGLAGSNIDQVIDSLGKLNKGLGDAAKTGQGPAVDALRELGISMNDPIVKSGDLDKILLAVARKFETTTSLATKTRIATGLFGRQGANLIPVFNQGADAIEELKKEARDLGIVLSKSEIDQLDQLGDDADRAKSAWTGMKNQLVLAIVPTLQEVLTDGIKWLRENKEQVKEFFQDVGSVVAFFVKAVAFVAPKLALPIRGLVFLIKKIVAGIKAIVPVLVDAANAIGEAFVAAWDWIGDKFRAVWNGITGAIDAVGDAFSALADGIKEAWNDAIDWLVEKWNDFLDLPGISHAIEFWKGNPEGAKRVEDRQRALEQSPAFSPFVRPDNSPEVQQRARALFPSTQSDTPSIPSTIGAGGPVSIRGGDISVNVTGSTDPNATANLVKKVVRDEMDTWLREAEAVS